MGNKLFLLIGKSASGKDSVYSLLLQRFEGKLIGVTPYTTRPMRQDETDGLEYFFVSNQKFAAMKAKGKVLESRTYNTVCGKWTYFTADDGQIDLAKSSVLMIATPQMCLELKKSSFGDSIVPLYIEVEDEERLMRAIWRERRQSTPNYAEVCRRYLADEQDFAPEVLEKIGIEKKYYNWKLVACAKMVGDDIERVMESK
ncbi:MAG: guanylate kinase [Lachnospiraceae bacterium]|nr:guanylate kinase [Lachnospiraceae bacterium]